jgi:arsenite methyltransferase
MTDPFQDVDAGGDDFVDAVAQALEVRAQEPIMVKIVEDYLDLISYPPGGIHIEVGAGTGVIARRLAARATTGQVISTDPSPGLVAAGQKLGTGISNLSFEVAGGASLRFDESSIDTVLFHTVLSHVPDPSLLLAEAARVLRPGGTLVVCDADFEKTSLSNFQGDPLDMCAKYFAENFVTDKYLVSKLRALVADAGFDLTHFEVTSRVITQGDGGMTWVGMGGQHMVKSGQIGPELAQGLVAEYQRRKENGSLYGHLPFATLVAQR